MTKPSLSVVLPAYNAAGHVAVSVQRLRSELGQVFPELEIVVVDDGSDDKTQQLARQAGADQVIVFDQNRGKGAAVRAGVLAASCDVVVFTDVDLSYGPDVIHQLVDALGDGTQVCVGVRSFAKKNSSSRMRQFGSNFIGLLARVFLSFHGKTKSIHDTQCGVKAFESACAKQLFAASKIDRFAFDIELFHLMFSWGLDFKTVEVSPSIMPASTVRALRDGMKTLVDILRIARFERAGAYEPTVGAAASGEVASSGAQALFGGQASLSAQVSGEATVLPTEAAINRVVKSYDIRGKVPAELNEALVARLGSAFADFWKQDDPSTTQILCGRDMRTSSQALAQSFMEAVRSRGLEAIDLGLISTDMLYFASGSLDLPGAVFTASHNPAQYNGIKACRRQAAPIGSETGLETVKQLALMSASGGSGLAGGLEPVSDSEPVSGSELAPVRSLDILEEFVQHVKGFVSLAKLKPLRVVIDCANGMAGLTAPAVFEELPFEIVWLYPELDGTFPNHPADPLNPANLQDLQAKVVATKADIGIAFDGDGDRVFFVDEQASPLSGSATLGILAKAVLAKTPGATILYNVVCSRAVPELVRELGGQPIATKVGHSHIKAQMSSTDALFGGEHSGHYYFRDNFKADSGLIAALMLLELLSQASESLSQMRLPSERYFASDEQNFEVPEAAVIIEKIAEHYADLPQERLDGLSVDAGSWWFNVRTSQTEPLVRVNLEAVSSEECRQRLAELKGLIRSLHS